MRKLPPLLQTVLAGIDRDADDPGLLMFGSGEGDGSCQGFQKDVLASRGHGAVDVVEPVAPPGRASGRWGRRFHDVDGPMAP